MRVIARRTLQEFWERHADAKEPLEAWLFVAQRAFWSTPADVKRRYVNASVLGDNRICFNIKGNDYRLIVHIHYEYQIIRIKFVGTHAEYDRIDAATVGHEKAEG